MEHILRGHRGPMRLAALSDIHSNHIALEAVLQYLAVQEKPDALLFLGDFLTDFPEPEKTLALLNEAADTFPSVFIRGNREEYLLRDFRDPALPAANPVHPSSQTGSLQYTASKLTPQVWRWLESLPDRKLVAPGSGPPLTIAHGSLKHSRELLYPGTRALQDTLELMETKLLLHGHTHHRALIEHGDKRIADVGIVAYNGRPEFWGEARLRAYIDNPQQGQETIYASTLLLDLDPGAADYALRFVDVPYDPWMTVRAFPHSELAQLAPWWSRAVVREMLSGQDYILALVLQAGELARAAGVTGSHIPEEFFAQSFRMIIQRDNIPAKYPEALKPYLR